MFLIRIIILFLICNLTIYSQVNTEAYRNDGIKKGFKSRFDLLLGLNAGNSEYLSGEGKLRVDYVADEFRTFLTGEIAYKKGNQEVISNKGFLHGRLIYTNNQSLQPELFLQKEYNEFVLLLDRNLAGLGLRYALSNTDFVVDSSVGIKAYLGVGAMYEMEKINTQPKFTTEIIRSTNYLTIAWKPTEKFLLNSVTYFQVNVNRFNDHRILNESQLQFKITDALSFIFSVSYRFDKEPPKGIGEYDLELKNGITIEI
ncbi:DUF481 domain-containing protein [bacterium]|nr:MAG: DUF481 domain-containing protein [bacterium]